MAVKLMLKQSNDSLFHLTQYSMTINQTTVCSCFQILDYHNSTSRVILMDRKL